MARLSRATPGGFQGFPLLTALGWRGPLPVIFKPSATAEWLAYRATPMDLQPSQLLTGSAEKPVQTSFVAWSTGGLAPVKSQSRKKEGLVSSRACRVSIISQCPNRDSIALPNTGPLSHH